MSFNGQLRDVVVNASKKNKLARLRGVTTDSRTAAKARVMAPLLLEFVRVAAVSGCPVAKRLVKQWEDC